MATRHRHTGGVADLIAPPADGLTVRWAVDHPVDGPVDGTASGPDGPIHDETLVLGWENEAWTATGRVGRERVEYVIRLSPMWQVRQFLLFRDLDEPDLWLGTDGRGHWGEINGAHRPELDGAFDLALACTPFTHALPIRRVPLAVGGAAELIVVAIDVETLAVEPVAVRYERIGARRYRSTGAGGVEEFDVDEHGLPLDLPGAFRRVG